MTHETISAIRKRCEGATEIWKPIPGYEGVYDVSNLGEVRSYLRPGNNLNKKDSRPRILKRDIKNRKYRISVSLTNAAGKAETKSVPKLVMMAFIGPRPEGLEIAHLNGDFTDNRLSNLKYCTHKENESHKRLHGTIAKGELSGAAKLCEWKVAEIKYLLDKGIIQRKLCALFDVSPDTISTIASGENWSHVDTKKDIPALLARVEELESHNSLLKYSLQVATKSTHCAGCGVYKMTPTRRHDGYICAGCLEKECDEALDKADALEKERDIWAGRASQYVSDEQTYGAHKELSARVGNLESILQQAQTYFTFCNEFDEEASRLHSLIEQSLTATGGGVEG